MTEHVVTGANVADEGQPHQHITKLCGDGFSYPVEEVLRRMAAGETFHVQVPGEPRVQVLAAHLRGRPYVKTAPDDTARNNLLRLTSTCP